MTDEDTKTNYVVSKKGRQSDAGLKIWNNYTFSIIRVEKNIDAICSPEAGNSILFFLEILTCTN